MQFVNLPKFILALTTVVGIFVLIGIGQLHADIGIPVITGTLGIGIGNGIAFKQGQIVTPMVGRQDVTPTESTPPTP